MLAFTKKSFYVCLQKAEMTITPVILTFKPYYSIFPD